MPIQPPRLDDRSYADLVREAKTLIPQYCPEWTHLGDADPGMTIVQLFAWMTELTLYRLNRVPDKTYVHFLNFIGEERRTATPAASPVTFRLQDDDNGPVELPALTACATKQQDGGEALHFLTRAPVTVHGASIARFVAVRAGAAPAVRELPVGGGSAAPGGVVHEAGLVPFAFDPRADGPHAYASAQDIYIRHTDLARLGRRALETPAGTLRIRGAGDPGHPVAALFDWAYPIQGEDGVAWVPLTPDPSASSSLMGLPEDLLPMRFDGMIDLPHLGGDADAPLALPQGLPADGWLRGRVAYERWLAALMDEELRITWRDDRGGDERELPNWSVRAVGRAVELFVQNLPPVRSGWTVRLTLVDHGLAAGRDGVFPAYRWSWRRGDRWVPIPEHRVELIGATWVLTGPFPDMAADGFNLRAERVETVHLDGLLPELGADLVWRRPIEVHLAQGPEASGAVAIPTEELPITPFQTAPTVPALLGMKWFLGTDLLANRAERDVLLEIEVGFERDGELVAEPADAYHLQLTFRTENGWEVVKDDARDFSRFTFADLDPDGAKRPERRTLRLVLDPAVHLEGLVGSAIGGSETSWLRFELTRAALVHQEDAKSAPEPITLRVFAVRLGLDGSVGATSYDEPLPGARVVAVTHRPDHRRFTTITHRDKGELVTAHPYDPVLDLGEPDAPHHALYLALDRPLPVGAAHAFQFRLRGEAFRLPGTEVHWELLQATDDGTRRWTRLATPGEAYALDRTGTLAFPLDTPMTPAAEGVWIRAVIHTPEGASPALPPLTHVLPNTVEAVNLHAFRTERTSGEGVPQQVLQLDHFPVYLPDDDEDPELGLHVEVEEEDGSRHRWRMAVGNRFAEATKDDRWFTVDAVEGTLTFGNGIRGRILPSGAFNVTIERYHAVPGAAGNVAAGAIEVVDAWADLVTVTNPVPASGGRDAESIDEIVRRAPSVLTTRNRVVTRDDFEVVAAEASAEVARAACLGEIGEDGTVEVIVLPRRRGREAVPDPFLSAGLVDHVQAYLRQRALVNVRPVVRLATFRRVDVSLDLRLRPGANRVAAREAIAAWVRRFLDAYRGGLDGDGWPFGATVFAQDFGRVVADLPDVRHVADVRVYAVDADEPAGWETGQGERTLPLVDHDLVHLRHVRVRWAEEVR